MSLNKLPNGEDSPRYKCTAYRPSTGETHTAVLTEWWCDGKRVESIEESAENYFYDFFDKGIFKITKIQKVSCLDRRT